MTNPDRKRFDALARKAGALRNVWLQEREERLAARLASNAEVRKRWIEADSIPGLMVEGEVVDFTSDTAHQPA